MTTKRTASMKAKAKKPELSPIEEVWDMVKGGLVMTAETQATIARRTDTMLSVKNAADQFRAGLLAEGEGRYTMADLRKWQTVVEDTYDAIAERFRALTLEDMSKEEIDDPFADLLKKAEAVKDADDLFCEFLRFGCVQPYGEKLIKAHQLMRDEIGKRSTEEN